eukprot:scaffold86724_cov42-Prasinocladus_malaysianus.AAC.1
MSRVEHLDLDESVCSESSQQSPSLSRYNWSSPSSATTPCQDESDMETSVIVSPETAHELQSYMRHLGELDCNASAAVRQLCLANCADAIHEDWLSSHDYTQTALQKMTHLNTLDLSYCSDLDEATLLAIIRSLPRPDNLFILRAAFVPSVTDAVLVALSETIPNLKVLDIQGCHR